MIFVSMSQHDLLARTDCYRMRDPSPSRNTEFADPPPFLETSDENRPLSRRRDSGANRAIPPSISNSITRNTRFNHDIPNNTSSNNNNPFPLIDIGDDSTPPPRTTTAPETTGFNITNTCNDPSSDEEEESSEATLADLFRRDRLPPPYSSSTEEDDEEALERAMRRVGHLRGPPSQRRSRRRAKPSRIEVAWPHNATGSEAEKGVVKDVLAPHARFFIESERSVVSIKFDPPV